MLKLLRKLPNVLLVMFLVWLGLSCTTASAGDVEPTANATTNLTESEISVSLLRDEIKKCHESAFIGDYHRATPFPIMLAYERASLASAIGHTAIPKLLTAASTVVFTASDIADIPFEPTLKFLPIPSGSGTESEEVDTEPEPEEPAVQHEPLLPNIPLDGETQWQIYVQACHEDMDKFCLLMAMANFESGYDPLKIGDDGDSYGVVQIMFKWHMARLEKYGFTIEDLFDPVKCCIIAIDYLEEQAAFVSDEFAVSHELLMRYNMGPGNAVNALREGHHSSYYSREVMPLYEQLLTEFVAPIQDLAD